MALSKRQLRMKREIEEILEELSDVKLELYGEDFFLGKGNFSRYVVKVKIKGDKLNKPYVLKIIELNVGGSGSLSSLKKKSKNELDKLMRYWDRIKGCINRGHVVNVAGIYEVIFEDTGESYGLILMEYCESNLLGAIESGLKEEDKRKIFRDILVGLKCLLNEGVIYTDLKPQNILIRSGRGLIGDLGGISSLSTKSIGETTPVYQAPELLIRDITKRDEKSLMWSIGVVMYELFEERELFEGVSSQIERINEILEKGVELNLL